MFQFDAQDCPPGLVNYWGYSPISFFAPHAAYSSRRDPLGPVDEFRDMVKALHRAGIEVILDAADNDTAEANQAGPTLCFRGIDNPTYYILDEDRSRYADYGNGHVKRQPSRGPPHDPRQPALLGRGNACGRVPLRSRLNPGPRYIGPGAAQPPVATEQFDLARKSFRLGEINAFDLYRVRQLQLDAQRARAAAAIDLGVALSRLNQAWGYAPEL